METRSQHPRQTILGQPPSKSNCYKIIKVGGFTRLGKDAPLVRYEESFFQQCGLRGALVSKRFRLDVDVYYASDRPDLDNSLKIILDCLQTCKVIKNDRLCAEIHARKLVDKNNPRIEFIITELL